jgi:hypothetical protein
MTRQVRQVSELSVLLDDTNPALLYVGEAASGSSTSAPSWRIKRVDLSSGVILVWADGNSNFDNVWDNRASLTYS